MANAEDYHYFFVHGKKTFNKYQVRKILFFFNEEKIVSKVRYCYCKHVKNLIIIIC